MIYVVCCQTELLQSESLFFVSDVQKLMEEQADYGEEETQAWGSWDDEGQDEEGEKWEEGQGIGFGFGMAALKEIVCQFVVEVDVEDGLVDDLLLECFDLGVVEWICFCHYNLNCRES